MCFVLIVNNYFNLRVIFGFDKNFLYLFVFEMKIVWLSMIKEFEILLINFSVFLVYGRNLFFM